MTTPPTTTPPPPTSTSLRDNIKGFLVAGVAAVGATTITNPMEVVKTRLQLQGELKAIAERPYKGIAHAFQHIYKHEGIRGLQRGLFPAYLAQAALNGGRLGFYPIIKRLMNNTPDSQFFFLKNVAAGATAGAIGATLASPFDLVKVRIQAQSPVVHFGQTWYYKNLFDGFSQLYKENGIRALYRGARTSAQRTAVGSSVQLSTYDQLKNFVMSTGYFEDNIYAYLVSSAVASLVVTTAMNPFDVARTRIYNQKVDANGKGLYYKGMLDCIFKTVKTEGFFALYKGYGAHYLRLGPHTILIFVFWEQLKKIVARLDI